MTKKPFYQEDYRFRALLVSLAVHLLAGVWIAGRLGPTLKAPEPLPLEVTFIAFSGTQASAKLEPVKVAAPAFQARRAALEPTVLPTAAGVATTESAPIAPVAEARQPGREAPHAGARENASPDSTPLYAAEYLSNPAPVYPALSRRLGEEGKVVLRVHVTAEGRAAQVAVAESSGSHRLDRVAEETVWRYRFVPARRGGEAIDAWVRVPMVFKLEG